jgi:alpha-beta hydrolase superfamily lysophospholipase
MTHTFQIKNSKGERLDCLYYAGTNKRLIILCHGFGGDKSSFGISSVAAGLNANGFSTFLFDFTGQGKSEGDSDLDLHQQVADIKTIVDNFKSKYSDITVMGGSMGGLVSFISGLHMHEISRLILVNPFFYLFKKVHWNHRKYILTTLVLSPFYRKIRSVYACYFKNFHPEILKTPTLIIAGTQDKMVSCVHSQCFYNEIKCEKKLIIDDEIDHDLTTQFYVDRVVNYIVNWLTT